MVHQVSVYFSLPIFGIISFLLFPRNPKWQITYSHYRSINANADLSIDVAIDFTVAIYNPNFIGACSNDLAAQLFHEDLNGVTRHFGILKAEPFCLPARGYSLVHTNTTIDRMGSAVFLALIKELIVNEGVIKMSFKSQMTVNILGVAPAAVLSDCTEWVAGDKIPMRIMQSECRFDYGISLSSLSFGLIKKQYRPVYLMTMRTGNEQIYTEGPAKELG